MESKRPHYPTKSVFRPSDSLRHTNKLITNTEEADEAYSV